MSLQDDIFDIFHALENNPVAKRKFQLLLEHFQVIEVERDKLHYQHRILHEAIKVIKEEWDKHDRQ